MPSVFIFSVTRKKRRNLSKRKDVEAHLTAAVGRTPLQRMIPGPGIDTERSKFHISDSILLPPANEVCEGYVFTGVCLSTGWGGGVCPIACWDTPPGTRGRHPPGPEADTPWADTPLGQPPPGQTPPQDQRQTPPGRTPPCPGPETDTLQRQTPPLGRHPPWANTPRQTPSAVHGGIRSTSGRYASHWNAFLLWREFVLYL